MGTISDALHFKELNKLLKYEVFSCADDGMASDIPYFIPTGSKLVDIVCGGGLPGGKIIEFFGAEGGGKSTLLMQCYAQVQKMGGTAVHLDAENAMNREMAERMGVNLAAVGSADCDTTEMGFKSIIALLKMRRDETEKNKDDGPLFPLLIGWDSISASPADAEANGDDPFASGMSSRARVVRQGCRTITQLLPAANATFVAINQVQDKIGGWAPHGMKPVDTNVGRGVKHHSHIRVEVSAKGSFKEGNPAIPVGVTAQLRTRKNKIIRPACNFTVPLYSGKGVDDAYSCLLYLRDEVAKLLKLQEAPISGRKNALKMEGVSDPFSEEQYHEWFEKEVAFRTKVHELVDKYKDGLWVG